MATATKRQKTLIKTLGGRTVRTDVLINSKLMHTWLKGEDGKTYMVDTYSYDKELNETNPIVHEVK